MEDKITVSITILLTGFVVVFAVLLLLIGIIKLYGTIVYKIQNKDKATPKIDVVLNESEKQLLEEIRERLKFLVDDQALRQISSYIL